jgi:hypothetical protein
MATATLQPPFSFLGSITLLAAASFAAFAESGSV